MIGRVLAALIESIRLTLRRETPTQAKLRSQNPALAAWCAETVRHVASIDQTITQQKIDPEKTVTRIDGRDRTLATALRTVRFHAETEYPFLITGGDPYSALTLQATNLNDRFAIERLREVAPSTLQDALGTLAKHLEAPPKS